MPQRVQGRRRSAAARAAALGLLLLAPLVAAAQGWDGFRITFEVQPAQSDKVQVAGEVLNERTTEVLEVYVTAEALDRAGRVLATGITYVDSRIGPGRARSFVAVVPAAPGAVRYRVSVSSFRAGFGVQTP